MQAVKFRKYSKAILKKKKTPTGYEKSSDPRKQNEIQFNKHLIHELEIAISDSAGKYKTTVNKLKNNKTQTDMGDNFSNLWKASTLE